MEIAFTVYGVAKPKARARVVRTKAGKTVAFTPDDTAGWENSVLAQALKYKPDKPLEVPLEVQLDFYLPRPKSVRRSYPAVRPDLDNYIKSVMDALNGVIYQDDALVIQQISGKWYGDPPRVEVRIREVG